MATFKKKNTNDYRAIVLDSTRTVDYLNQFADGGPIVWLAKQIQSGKRKLKYNAVDFIIGKLLNKNEGLINYQKHDFINIYVIGTFRSEFIATMKVANSLAEFYLEMEVMPNIIPISKKEFLNNQKYSINKIRNGILIYDRERHLY